MYGEEGVGKTQFCRASAKFMFDRKFFDFFVWVDITKDMYSAEDVRHAIGPKLVDIAQSGLARTILLFVDIDSECVFNAPQNTPLLTAVLDEFDGKYQQDMWVHILIKYGAQNRSFLMKNNTFSFPPHRPSL